MAESALSLGYPDFALAVGRYLGYGSDYTLWAADQTAEVDEVVQAGYRKFLNPMPVPGDSVGHTWSFLSPRTTIEVFGDAGDTLVGAPVSAPPISTITVVNATFFGLMVGKNFVFATSGNSYPIASVVSTTVCTVTGDASGELVADTFTIDCNGNFDLPDDFGAIIGNLHYDEDFAYRAVMERGQGQILAWRQGITSEAVPTYFAIGTKAKASATGTRFEVMMYPTPDRDYTLTYRYALLATDLDRTLRPYPIGGMFHGETIKAAIMAEAELVRDETKGPRHQEFIERLTASVNADRNLMTPATLGALRDNADEPSEVGPLIRGYTSYAGVVYDGS